ncbi:MULTISPECIES: hypothetical protein [Actinoalloteichus]|uniref:Uncharacterized protein n=1 Tax=Actinoalloteichus fjordicus TaxID=1612552 RepID=A0AAC9PTM4_9PSEU|nr:MULTISPECIES: hypothetical protein [Actinoalloteichus]APU16192.1 hypothetical protein UA74_20835 [Actinoalloteichus fjordicus]APU22254.1 hypothetical protein UA75_21325 [Actinoalloteichus sp. GBA129-24]
MTVPEIRGACTGIPPGEPGCHGDAARNLTGQAPDRTGAGGDRACASCSAAAP